MGKIFNIQKFCVNDGPGIRTTVFFKGCPLHCLWCHNPESQNINKEMMYNSDKCINCLSCVDLCKRGCHYVLDGKHVFNREKCVLCGNCISDSCRALEIIGYEATTDEIIREVMKDRAFYENSGGGITLSGGEPLFQPEFCIDLLKKAKENKLHICMETCGCASEKIIKATADYVDIYLFDCKETNTQKHLFYTGINQKSLIDNLYLLDKMNKKIILRCPIIPGYNDNDEHFLNIANISNNLTNLLKIEIEPYHNYGIQKYKSLGREYKLFDVSIPSNDIINSWIKKIQQKTKVNVQLV